jgi:hypothetical protein
MSTVSYPMPANCETIEDVRSRILRASYVYYGRRPLLEGLTEVSNNSFILYGEWNAPGYLTYPFDVSVTYANNTLQYTPLTQGGPRAFRDYLTQQFIPQIHPH